LLWLLDAVDVINVSAGVVLPAALILVGLVLVVASFTGRRHGLLIVVGIVLTVILAFASSFDIRLQGGVGQRVERPASLGAAATYRLSVGQLTIDLRQTSLSAGATVTASVGIGQLVVQVPAEATIQIHGHAGAGDVRILGQEESGLDVDHRLTYSPVGLGRGSLPTLSLELRVGLGQVQVTQ
jgi:hypothetical protein